MKVSQCVRSCTVTVYFLKLHAPRLARDAGRIPVRKNYLVRKYRPKEVAHLVAHPVPPKAPRGPLTFPGRFNFTSYLWVLVLLSQTLMTCLWGWVFLHVCCRIKTV